MSDDYIIEKVEKNSDGENSGETHFRSVHLGRVQLGWKTKLKIAAFVVGGIAVGTICFLFFLTLFIYCFIPAVFLISIWGFFNRRR